MIFCARLLEFCLLDVLRYLFADSVSLLEFCLSLVIMIVRVIHIYLRSRIKIEYLA